jgi:hypothetical protein
MAAPENHNRLAPAIVKQLVREGGTEAETMIVLESVILGLMLYFRPDPRHAAEFLDVMTSAVLERMKP